MLTDNPVLVRKHRPMPTLMCVQRKAPKKQVSEEDLIEANIASFGNDIGRVTNWVTSMYEVQSHFQKDSEQYRTLAYRIRSGQQYQQNTIDRSKGIIAKPMPRNWHDRFAVSQIQDPKTQQLYRDIAADRKPYFMRYIYPALMKQYHTYIKNTERSALREFGLTVRELQALPYRDLTERQKEFLSYYERFMPVGTGNCVMNQICRIFERCFDGYPSKYRSADYDYSYLKCGADYTRRQFTAVKRLYEEYQRQIHSFMNRAKTELLDTMDTRGSLDQLREEYRRDCLEVCSDARVLCDILVDLCYHRNASRGFVWSMCGDVILEHLLEQNGGVIRIPVADPDGDITYGGDRFRVVDVRYGSAEEADEAPTDEISETDELEEELDGYCFE